MLAFVMLWAYFSFSQYLIIYSGNLPEEITWYTHRLGTGWRFVGLALVLFHFAVPFVLLLSRKVKRAPELLIKVAVGILVARLIDLFWLIAPTIHHDGLVVHWLDIVLRAGARIALARLLRLAASRPRDSAAARPAVRAGARAHCFGSALAMYTADRKARRGSGGGFHCELSVL